MRSDSVSCAEVADHLAAAVDGPAPLRSSARRHVETCLRCPAELVQYRKLRRELAALRHEVVAPEPDLLPGLLAALELGEAERLARVRGRGRRVAYVGGIAAAATAAGAGAAIVLATRTRRRLVA